MSATTLSFSPQLIGQTEKTLNAILDRELTGTDVTESQWVTLTLTVTSGGTVDRDQLIARVAGGLRISEAEAQARIAELTAAQLLQASDGEGSPVTVTVAGQQFHGRIRATVTEITQRLWGDLPAEELATAGRVLSTILERANAELDGA
jgi:hypothetical protein